MKSKHFVVLVLLLAVVIGFLSLIGRHNTLVTEKSATDSDQHAPAANNPSHIALKLPQHVKPTNQPFAHPTNSDPHLAELTRKFMEEMRADPAYQFKIPIRFYGKVLDEEDRPVAEAEISFEWNTLGAANKIEAAKAATKTDAEGRFSLENQKGNALCVVVSKPGYYNTRENPLCFEYAQPYAENYHTPDPNAPVVFRLRKKGHAVTLITSQNGMRPDLRLTLPQDGTPTRVDLMQQKTGTLGPLEISQMKPDPKLWKQANEWSFRMAIPDGGFLEHHDEFPFEAPETGYHPVEEFNFQKGQTNWTTDLSKDYYIRFGNPPIYGRLHVETAIDNKGARITYAINPDGSRNLESK